MNESADAASDSLRLRRGAEIPIIGFGTWQITGPAAREAVTDALEVGYRHLDTATVYGNEREVGQALADSQVPRGEVFVTSKLPGNATVVRPFLERSLTALGTDYLDLWLIHWPPAHSYQEASGSSRELYQEMLTLREEGLVRAVGVSNYSAAEIDELIEVTGESPEVNQIPWSPFQHEASTRTELDARQVCLEGYSPLALSTLGSPVLVEIAADLGVTPARVILRWHVQHGVVVLPKSEHRERIEENYDLFGFSLTADQMARVDALSLP